MPITSLKNPLIQRYRDAAHGVDKALMVADGVTPVADALAAGRTLVDVAVAPALETSARGPELLAELERRGVVPTACNDAVLARLSHLTTPQGVVALVERPQWSDEELLGGGRAVPLLLVAAGVKDPGNLGALVRTAEAAGATGLVALHGGADPFRDKAVRGSSASVFRLPVRGCADPNAVVAWLSGAGVPVLLADTGPDATAHSETDLRGPLALVVGGETGGVPRALLAGAHRRVRIPMAAAVDSLNVAVAAGVLLFEARRQRGGGSA